MRREKQSRSLSEIRMLAKAYAKENKGRNYLLFLAAVIFVVAFTLIFGIADGKIKAEYEKAMRDAGTEATVCIQDADQTQYHVAESLSYVKAAGRSAGVGGADWNETPVCGIRVLDQTAWEEMIAPACLEVFGKYPRGKQEIMMPVEALERMGITQPKQGMEIPLTVDVSLFRSEQDTFHLSGWYTSAAKDVGNRSVGYISEAKYREWGYDLEEKAELWLKTSKYMGWRKTEERLYQDLPVNQTEPGVMLEIKAQNPYAYSAVNELIGGYELAVLGALFIVTGLFFLIYNVMQISMAGDIRQMGLLHTLGMTKRQIRSVYFQQIFKALIPGVLAGTALSIFLLKVCIPRFLEKSYLAHYGEVDRIDLFSPFLLLFAVLLAAAVTLIASEMVIQKVVRMSCVDSLVYTHSKKIRLAEKRKRKRKKRGVAGELVYMAWRNITRYQSRFWMTVLSLFLGMETFLCAIVIINGADYIHVIENRPDVLIAGEFSEGGQKLGYGIEYRLRDAGEDPMETKGDHFELLYSNDYDEFSPISSKLKEELLNLPEVDKENSYVMEGAYLLSTISRKAVSPMDDHYSENQKEKEGTGYDFDSAMVESVTADVIQILTQEELKSLKSYVEKQDLPVDLRALEEGKGAIILHDHRLSKEQEELAKESVGEPLYFTAMWSKEEREKWLAKTQEEREQEGEAEESRRRGKTSEPLILAGYLDNRAEGFPTLRQTWHGSEGSMYYLMSEKGAEKLPTKKKTLYMELKAKEGQEEELETQVQELLKEENQRKEQNVVLGMDGTETKEAGVFCICKSEFLAKASSYIKGNRLVLGCISLLLLAAGFTNYCNVCMTGILERRKELKTMRSLGMTKRQMWKMLMLEGGFYALIVIGLILSVGNVVLALICRYMEGKLSYFTAEYPYRWLIFLCVGMLLLSEGILFFLFGRKKQIAKEDLH